MHCPHHQEPTLEPVCCPLHAVGDSTLTFLDVLAGGAVSAVLITFDSLEHAAVCVNVPKSVARQDVAELLERMAARVRSTL